MSASSALYHGSDKAFSVVKGSKAAYSHDGYGAGHVWTTTSKKVATHVARHRHLLGGKPVDQIPGGAKEILRRREAFKDRRILHKVLTRSLPTERRAVGHLHEVHPEGFAKPNAARMAAGGATNAHEQKHLIPTYRVKKGDARVTKSTVIREGRATRPLLQKEADAIAVGAGGAGSLAAAGAAGGMHHHSKKTGSAPAAIRPKKASTAHTAMRYGAAGVIASRRIHH